MIKRKLIFAFDLSNKDLSAYQKIRKTLEKIYLKQNVTKILDTTYVIIHPTDTPKDLVNHMVTNWFIWTNNHCFCDEISNNARFFLNQEQAEFIQK